MELSPHVLHTILAGYDLMGYTHTASHLKKLHDKIGHPSVQTQLKTCMDAYAVYTKTLDVYHTHTDNEDMDLYGEMDQAHWWVYESMAELVALIDEHEYKMVSDVEWDKIRVRNKL